MRHVERGAVVNLWVDPMVHAAECARFQSYVVTGPTAGDCDIWCGAIGADGYGRFSITQQGKGLCVRPHRYALALATGEQLGSTLALHECDIPVCVKWRCLMPSAGT